MRRKRAKERIISIIVLFSVFIFFMYLKMNPEVNTESFTTEMSSVDKLEKDIIIKNNKQNIEDNNSINAEKQLDVSKSIIQYTESELNRAKAYLNRNWKPDHTINIAAWEYINRVTVIKDENSLKEDIFDMEKNQVVNAIK